MHRIRIATSDRNSAVRERGFGGGCLPKVPPGRVSDFAASEEAATAAAARAGAEGWGRGLAFAAFLPAPGPCTPASPPSPFVPLLRTPPACGGRGIGGRSSTGLPRAARASAAGSGRVAAPRAGAWP